MLDHTEHEHRDLPDPFHKERLERAQQEQLLVALTEHLVLHVARVFKKIILA
jgi:hypothetical protein